MGVSLGMFGAIECHPSCFSYVRGAPPYLTTAVKHHLTNTNCPTRRVKLNRAIPIQYSGNQQKHSAISLHACGETESQQMCTCVTF